MNAGRELDALIAEKVFGRTPEELFYTGTRDLMVCPPNYSTDIKDAWEVVNRILPISIEMHKRSDGSAFIKIYYVNDTGSIRISNFNCSIEAKTVPHAICLVAIEAFKNGSLWNE